MSLEPGQILDKKYRIVRKIGEGGMGAVYEGENTFIRRRVAIKVLHAGADPTVMTRFEREAQAAGRIGSDHILEVLDLGQLENGDRFMVMEFLDGLPLADRIKQAGSLIPEEAFTLARQALVGLAAAHAAGIVHRDLKPDNIFVLREKAGHKNFVKIIDFGISKFNALNGDLSMTSTGAVMGTPYYMAPEQARGASTVDARTDIYAMGVILYEALSGGVPFDGLSFNDLMFKIVLSDAPPLPEHIPDAVRTIVSRAMARDQADRYQNTEEFIAAIDAWANGVAPQDFVSRASARTLPNGSAAAAARTAQPDNSERGKLANSATVLGAPADIGLAVDAGGVQGRTGVNWAATQGDANTSNSSTSRGIVIGAVAALLVAAGAFFVLRPTSGEGAAPEGGFVAEQAAKPVAEQPATPQPEKPAAVPVAAEPAPVVAAPAAPAPEPVVAEPAKATTAKPATVAKTPAKPATVEPAPAPAKPKPTKPSAPDFGY